MKKGWRIFTGLATGGLSEAGLGIKKGVDKHRENLRNELYGAPGRWAESGNTLGLGRGIDPGAMSLGGYQDPGRLSVGGYQGPGAYVGAGDQARYGQELFEGLGFDPSATSAAIRAAGKTALNKGAHEAAVADASKLSASGLSDSGTASALSSRRGMEYAASDADLEMKAAMDEAARRQYYDTMQLDAATRYGEAASQYGLGASNAQNQFNLDRSGLLADYGIERAGMRNQFGLDVADYNLNRAGVMNDEDYRRQMAEYEANTMFPITTAAGQQAARQSMWGQLGGGMISAAGSAAGAGITACWVADVLWGPDDDRTHAARHYASTVDTPFTIAYRRHGELWARMLERDPEMLSALRPIWDEMAAAGSAMLRKEAA